MMLGWSWDVYLLASAREAGTYVNVNFSAVYSLEGVGVSAKKELTIYGPDGSGEDV